METTIASDLYTRLTNGRAVGFRAAPAYMFSMNACSLFCRSGHSITLRELIQRYKDDAAAKRRACVAGCALSRVFRLLRFLCSAREAAKGVVRSRFPRRAARLADASGSLLFELMSDQFSLGGIAGQLARTMEDSPPLPLPSVSTIGRIIARAPDKMRYVPQRLDARGRQKPVRRCPRARKPKNLNAPPMNLWAVDTIERIRDGMHRYVMSFLDPASRIGLAVALPSKSSANIAKALNALLQGLCPGDNLPMPRSIAFLSDNGSEFKGCFDALLERQGLTHYWTYPRCPKMNAHNERFNRTLQEQFVDYHEDLLFTDINAFNRKLAQWVIQYNTIIPHHSLGLTPPLQYLLNHPPQCQRYWTYTTTCAANPRGIGSEAYSGRSVGVYAYFVWSLVRQRAYRQYRMRNNQRGENA